MGSEMCIRDSVNTVQRDDDSMSIAITIRQNEYRTRRRHVTTVQRDDDSVSINITIRQNEYRTRRRHVNTVQRDDDSVSITTTIRQSEYRTRRRREYSANVTLTTACQLQLQNGRMNTRRDEEMRRLSKNPDSSRASHVGEDIDQ